MGGAAISANEMAPSLFTLSIWKARNFQKAAGYESEDMAVFPRKTPGVPISEPCTVHLRMGYALCDGEVLAYAAQRTGKVLDERDEL